MIPKDQNTDIPTAKTFKPATENNRNEMNKNPSIKSEALYWHATSDIKEEATDEDFDVNVTTTTSTVTINKVQYDAIVANIEESKMSLQRLQDENSNNEEKIKKLKKNNKRLERANKRLYKENQKVCSNT